MTKEKQAHQMELAAKILRSTPTPIWEYFNNGSWIHNFDTGSLSYAIGTELEIRIKPWELGSHVNGHTLGDGQEWHRQDWKESDLPEGFRPLTKGECTMDAYIESMKTTKHIEAWGTIIPFDANNIWMRTKLPLPVPTPKIKKLFPLGPEDDLVGCEFRYKNRTAIPTCWPFISWIGRWALMGNHQTRSLWYSTPEMMMKELEYKRPSGDWMPCSKPEPQLTEK